MTGTIELSEYVIDAIADAIVQKMQEPCEDAISRQAVYEQINCWIGCGEYRYTNATDYLTKRIADLPSAQPKLKTGHWIALENRFKSIDTLKCSECGQVFVVGEGIARNYCPNCGAKMVEP